MKQRGPETARKRSSRKHDRLSAESPGSPEQTFSLPQERGQNITRVTIAMPETQFLLDRRGDQPVFSFGFQKKIKSSSEKEI